MWCPGAVWNKFAISISYDSQPAENLPLNYNSFQRVFPTPPRHVILGHKLGSNGQVWYPYQAGVRFPIAAVQPLRSESIPHTGEVVGSPTAPHHRICCYIAFFTAHLQRSWKFAEERRANTQHRDVQNTCKIVCLRSLPTGRADPQE
jgi:hypothetical protein